MVIYSGILVAYRLNESNKEELSETITADTLIYSGLEDYTLSSGSSARHYYYFLVPDSNDSIYMTNTVLSTVEKDTGLQLSTILEYVDLSALDDKYDVSEMQEKWHVSGYPSFIACHVENGAIVIDNAIESTVDLPLSAENVEVWLMTNGLYTTYSEAPLETAAPD